MNQLNLLLKKIKETESKIHSLEEIVANSTQKINYYTEEIQSTGKQNNVILKELNHRIKNTNL